jgi:hypothetical protein
MDWNKGEFRTYRATTEMHVGVASKTLKVGDTVQFDGFTLKWDGEEYEASTFRGVVQTGWVEAVDS